jgi:flagellar biosynthesis anti-sigma factor FlgM
MDMKINPLYKASMTRYTEAVRKAGKPVSVSQGTDKVDFSESGRLFAQALQAAKNAEPVRTGLVQAIKERVDNGTYTVNPGAIAEKMLAVAE